MQVLNVDDIVRAVEKSAEINRNDLSFFFQKKKVTKLEIQGQLRSRHPHLKSVVLNAQQQRLQVALLVEIHYSLRYRSEDMSSVVIMSSPTQVAAFMSNGYALQRFQGGGGGTFRMDFKDVKFGDNSWEDHVAIDPDRAYGVDLKYVDVYQLMKFGAYAQDGQNMRIFTSGGSYYDSWIGFLGCENSQLSQVTVIENRVNSGKPKSNILYFRQGNPERSSSNGIKVDENVQRLEVEKPKSIIPHQRPITFFEDLAA